MPSSKRKRGTKPTEGQTSDQPVIIDTEFTSDSGTATGKRANSKKKQHPAALTSDSRQNLGVSAWPDHFKNLFKVFQSLNLVYTFCCTRKYLATTFETLKQAVENHTKRELTVEDIAQIKFLVPQSILFAYVSEDVLQVDAASERDRDYELEKDQDKTKSNVEVLLFEFVDGVLKRKVNRRPDGTAIKLRDEELKMPVFSQAQMQKLIQKRKQKFHSAIDSFLKECSDAGVDPVTTIRAQYHPHVPTRNTSDSDDSAANTNATGTETPNTPKPFVQSTIPPQVPDKRKPIAEIVSEVISTEDFYHSQIPEGGYQIFDSREASYGDLEFQLSQSIVDAIYNARGISRFYSHQSSALNSINRGSHVIVSTATSSGKSLIYQVPVIRELETNPDARAIYVFPTKALAQDQRKGLSEILGYMEDTLGHVRVETYDGDTPMEDRRGIREDARVIFTNPDMLHVNILPKEGQWRSFLKNLRFVVVDELHVYNGLFGSHMAFIMRRLRRICSAIGNNKVQFISCSATVANPEQHMKTIFGIQDVILIDRDGAPSGLKTFLCWNCPYRDPNDATSGRVEPVQESARLFVELILRGVRTIAFCRVRKVCELLMGAVKTELTAMSRQEVANRVMSYRGGYTAQDRRRIEKDMFEGKLLGIVATNALELGVDIGTLDAVLIVGFPYTISNLRQQSGRAGRRNMDSLSILIGDRFPTDQHFMANPSLIVTMPNPALQVDLENILVMEGHLQCAAYEMPIKPKEDKKYFGPYTEQMAEERLSVDDQGWYHCNERFRPHPHQCVSIRDTEDGHYAVVDITNGRNVILEEVEPSRATFTIYEGGVYLHQGFKYLVKEFNPDKRLAKVELTSVDWTTQQRDYTDIDPIEVEAIRYIPKSTTKAYYGPVRIRGVVFGFFKMDRNRRILDAVEVDNPTVEIFSKGMWIDVPKSALDILKLKRLNYAGAIHAAEHAVLSLLPNFVISSPGDVRTECKAPQKEFAKKETTRKRPARLTFYDAKGGTCGSGISTKAFEFVDLLLDMAVKRVEGCDCAEGCPECVASENCHEANAVLSKVGSMVILKSILNMEIDIDALPEGPEEMTPAGIETVILAEEVRMGPGGIKIEPLEEGSGIIKMEEDDEQDVKFDLT